MLILELVQCTMHVVSLAAVFSIVTQRSCLWGGALRDDTKNRCEGDYQARGNARRNNRLKGRSKA